MSHLHIPDGVLPPLLWAPGLALALIALVWSARAARDRSPKRIALQGALGGLMLAVMSIPLPVFALEYCLTLAGPVGVLLGPAGSYQVIAVVVVILAMLGQGGLTVVGLNMIVMGAGAAIARPVYDRCAARFGAPASLAIATAATQLVSGALWFALIALALRVAPSATPALVQGVARIGVFAAISAALWLLAIVIESAVAFGIGRFLMRVRPDLLPNAAAPTPTLATPAARSTT
jgi:ABC-type Co2+ transport system permease subunit